MPGQTAEFTLKEFINLIKALELGNYIYQNQRYSLPDKQYIQLPFDVTVAFRKFDNSVNSDEFKFLYPKVQLRNFLSKLERSARDNYEDTASAESNHSEYLIGFLLNHDIRLKIDNETLSLAKVIDDVMPINYCIRHEGKYYLSARPAFDFLSEQWRGQQGYPDLQTLGLNWKNHVEKCEQERIAKEQAVLQKQKQAELERRHLEELRAQQALMRAAQTFDGMVLDFEKFSYVIEAFIKTGRIELGNTHQNWSTKPKLYQDVSNLICHFSQMVRAQGFLRPTPDQLSAAFVNMMKAVILTAKVEGPHQQASQQLIGFMLYHNFQLQHANQRFNISDIMMAEMSPADHLSLAQFGGRKFPFLFEEWQKNQCFPGRNDLEKVIAAEQEIQRLIQPNQTFSPFYQQRQAQSMQAFQNVVANNAFHRQSAMPVPTYTPRLVW